MQYLGSDSLLPIFSLWTLADLTQHACVRPGKMANSQAWRGQGWVWSRLITIVPPRRDGEKSKEPRPFLSQLSRTIHRDVAFLFPCSFRSASSFLTFPLPHPSSLPDLVALSHPHSLDPSPPSINLRWVQTSFSFEYCGNGSEYHPFLSRINGHRPYPSSC